MSVDVTTTPRAVDVIDNIIANWTFWQCRGHLKTHFKPALSLSLRVRRHSSPGEGKTLNCYGSSVYTSQSTGWDCVAWPGVYTLCASAFYTATSATTSCEHTSSAHSNVKQGRHWQEMEIELRHLLHQGDSNSRCPVHLVTHTRFRCSQCRSNIEAGDRCLSAHLLQMLRSDYLSVMTGGYVDLIY